MNEYTNRFRGRVFSLLSPGPLYVGIVVGDRERSNREELVRVYLVFLFPGLSILAPIFLTLPVIVGVERGRILGRGRGGYGGRLGWVWGYYQAKSEGRNQT